MKRLYFLSPSECPEGEMNTCQVPWVENAVCTLKNKPCPMSVPAGDRITFHCLKGFLTESVKSMICISNGTFDGKPTDCRLPGRCFPKQYWKSCFSAPFIVKNTETTLRIHGTTPSFTAKSFSRSSGA